MLQFGGSEEVSVLGLYGDSGVATPSVSVRRLHIDGQRTHIVGVERPLDYFCPLGLVALLEHDVAGSLTVGLVEWLDIEMYPSRFAKFGLLQSDPAFAGGYTHKSVVECVDTEEK